MRSAAMERGSRAISRDGLRALVRAVCAANRLAHNLSGTHRARAFALKASILNILVLTEGAVRVNGVRSGEIVGLDILIDGRARLHCPMSRLSSKAQEIVRRKLGSRGSQEDL